MEPSPAGGGRRGRKRGGRSGTGTATLGEARSSNRRRKRRGRSAGGPGRGGGRGRGRDDHRAALEPVQDSGSVLGNRVVQKRKRKATDGPPDAFGLFCSYHLGVTVDDGYQKPSLDGTARRYGMPPEEIKTLLTEYEIDPDTISKTEFDLEGAQLDIRLAPEGISRTEIAREHFESYRACLGEQ